MLPYALASRSSYGLAFFLTMSWQVPSWHTTDLTAQHAPFTRLEHTNTDEEGSRSEIERAMDCFFDVATTGT